MDPGILAYIGWRHEHDHRQLVEIQRELNQLGVVINERNVGKLYRQFLALLGGADEQQRASTIWTQAGRQSARSRCARSGTLSKIEGIIRERS